jgi:hypothetical protein
LKITNEIGPTKGPQSENKPPYVGPRIKAAPAIRQVYWCDFLTDAQLSEIWKTRPALVIFYNNTLHGHAGIGARFVQNGKPSKNVSLISGMHNVRFRKKSSKTAAESGNFPSKTLFKNAS